MAEWDDKEDTLVLTDIEINRLAERLIAHHMMMDSGEWLEWGDVPHLGEYTFHRLCEAVDRYCNEAVNVVRREDSASGIDSVYLLQAAQSGRSAFDGNDRLGADDSRSGDVS